uniref:Uncharacterized protein n=1 Tax=Strix occidentalis caurina TaxID=311401 RepID=A0A8D0FAS0_STROC
MQSFTNLLLRHVIHRGCCDPASKRQCLQYLRALSILQLNVFNTLFVRETDIPESLITGEKISKEARPHWLVWTLVHAGDRQGRVPWRYYKLLLRRIKMQLMCVGEKGGKETEMGTLPPVPPEIYMSSIECCHKVARADDHELLFIINRKDFALRSIERTHSSRYILFSDSFVKGIEKMTPNKWKVVINRVKRLENYYLDTPS